MSQKLIINTTKPKEVINLTGILNDLLSKNIYLNGLFFINSLHTSCALTIGEFEPGDGDEDYVRGYEELKPKIQFKHTHSTAHGFADNLLTSTIGTSLFLPVQSTNLVLGTNQKVLLVEFAGPRERHLTVSFIKQEVDSAL